MPGRAQHRRGSRRRPKRLPELPEVETVRRDLASAVLGARVATVTVTGARSVRRQHPDEFARPLTGARPLDNSRAGH